MPSAQARVRTDRASRYLIQLAKHGRHMGTGVLHGRRRHDDGGVPPTVLRAESSDTEGVVDFGWGRCTMKATDTEYDLVVDAPRYTMVVSSLPSWPGWRVERNGDPYDPLEPNGSFLGFVVRPGRTHVRVYYSPTTFNVSAAVSLLTLAALVALSRESLRRRLAAGRRSAAAT